MLRNVIKTLIVIIFAVGLGILAFAGGGWTARALYEPKQIQINDQAPEELKSEMKVFWEAWDFVNSDFYKQPLDPTKMAYGAVSGMVDSLGDPHTLFEVPNKAAILNSQLSGSFEGIGAEVEMNQGRLTIVAPIAGTPAEKARLKAGDIILKVGDTEIRDMDIDAAISLIRGPKGTTVRLTVQRGTQPPFAVDIVRDKIPQHFVTARMLDGNIAYVRLSQFADTAPDELHSQLKSLLAQNPKGLIFDLRNDTGGYLQSAIQIAGEFLPADSLVMVEKDKSGNRTEFRAPEGGLATSPSLKIVLLVNGGSASASEIMAGAFKDYKRGTIIGTQTYKKGSVQIPFELSDKSQLRVTIAHFFSPLEHEINGVGITPDVVVPDPTDADINAGQDPQLDRALQEFNG